jgi:hypothetical protein
VLIGAGTNAPITAGTNAPIAAGTNEGRDPELWIAALE